MMDTVSFKRLKRPQSPNTYLLAPEGFCDEAEPDTVSDPLMIPPIEIYDAFISMIAARADWTLQTTDEARGLIHFVATSRFMRFKDDIHILILPEDTGDAGARLAVYSSSRIGHSDLGANRKRVMHMLTNLNKMLVKT